MHVVNKWAVEAMEKYAPLSLAEEWDNVGLIIGDENKPLSKILLALDFTDEVLDEAIETKAGLVITHHPALYKPIKKITSQSPIGRRLMKAISYGISVYSAHTNLDKAQGGTSDAIFDILGLTNKESLDASYSGAGLGRVGDMPVESNTTLRELAQELKNKLSLQSVSYAGNPNRQIKKVGICTGSSAEIEYFTWAVNRKCDVYVTGDLKYHNAQAAMEMGLALVDIGHYSESSVFKYLREYLVGCAAESEVDVEVLISETQRDIFNFI